MLSKDGRTVADQVKRAVGVFAGHGLDAVAVQVDHDRADAAVTGAVVLAGDQGELVGVALVVVRRGHTGDIAVGRVVGIAADVLRGPLVARGGHVLGLGVAEPVVVPGVVVGVGLVERQAVLARIQVGELVVTSRIRAGGGDHRAGAVEQLDGDVGHAAFTAVLLAVVVA
ncbi:MAG: hypothetical protein L6Q67_23660, partial [Zoogloea sp.]